MQQYYNIEKMVKVKKECTERGNEITARGE